jgi:hypothetical protein
MIGGARANEVAGFFWHHWGRANAGVGTPGVETVEHLSAAPKSIVRRVPPFWNA